MSRFTIIPYHQIEGKYLDRAQEIVEFWLSRKDAKKEDMIAMIAEGFQALENIRNGVVVEDFHGGQTQKGITKNKMACYNGQQEEGTELPPLEREERDREDTSRGH